MNRFLKTFGILVVSLFLLASGLDVALDHLTRSSAQNSFTVYNEKGTVLLTYNGDLNSCKDFDKPVAVIVPRFLHRT